MAAVRGFAGNTPQVAIVHSAARAALLNVDETVDHYEVQQHHA
jgi:hypothetical protein